LVKLVDTSYSESSDTFHIDGKIDRVPASLFSESLDTLIKESYYI